MCVLHHGRVFKKKASGVAVIWGVGVGWSYTAQTNKWTKIQALSQPGLTLAAKVNIKDQIHSHMIP